MSALADLIDTLDPETLTRDEWAALTRDRPVPLPTARRLRRRARPSEQSGDWRLAAACRGLDPKLFFPERGEDTSAAKAVCAGCPVRGACLAENLAEHNGIWGGTSEHERRVLRRTWARSS
jgi:WhiB family redox-sensing transcriptional regulator